MDDLQDLGIQEYIEVGKGVAEYRKRDIVKCRRCRCRCESFVPHAGEYDRLLPVREIDPEVI